MKCLILCLLASCVVAPAAIDKDPTPDEIQNFIKKFTDRETEFSHALDHYTYSQASKIMEISPTGGSYEKIEEVSFDSRNQRTFLVTHPPVNSLQNIVLTDEDEQDLQNVIPFAMTSDAASSYDITYKGREKVDEITCYKFSVKRKVLTTDRRPYFEGEIWVDDHGLQIIKTLGRTTHALRRGEDQQFPTYETHREQVDGKFWFPAYTYANDTLRFGNAMAQQIKVMVKYNNYKEFKTETKIQP